MRAPFSLLSRGRLACLALLAPSLALAQNPPPSATTGAASPDTPAAPLFYQGMALRPSKASQAQQLGAHHWRAANRCRVSNFPRGNADIVAWKAAVAKAGINTTSTAAPAPPDSPMQHGDNPSASPESGVAAARERAGHAGHAPGARRALMQKFPGMEHGTPHTAHVGAGGQGDTVWQFNRPSQFDFECLIEGH